LKSRKVRLTGPARQDLYRHRLTLEAIDADHAEARIFALSAKFFELADKGVTGSTRWYAPDYVRAFPWKKYCFYFRVDNGTLTLLRVLAQRENITEIAFEMPDIEATDDEAQ